MSKKTERVGTTPLRNSKHELFAQALARGLCADAAYQEAGFRPHRSNAARLSANERIQARVAHILAAGAERAEITVARLVEELGKIAFVNIGDVFESWGPDGIVLRESSELAPEVKAAIAEISETRSRGERTVRVKLHSKLDAAEKLGKYLGMFRERIEHSGPGGGPIETRSDPIVFRGIDLAEADEETLLFLKQKIAREREIARAD